KLAGDKRKTVNIKIKNSLVVGGKYGIAVLGIYNNPQSYCISGNINIHNLTTYYCAFAIKEFQQPKFDFGIKISNTVIYNKSKKGVDYKNLKQIDRLQKNIEILIK